LVRGFSRKIHKSMREGGKISRRLQRTIRPHAANGFEALNKLGYTESEGFVPLLHPNAIPLEAVNQVL
jgi:hypothetical protein